MVSHAYIHIPFCSHKCDFCDFAAFAGVDHLTDEYEQVVLKEIDDRLALLRQKRGGLADETMKSVFLVAELLVLSHRACSVRCWSV